jgi:hypothetical protein
MVGVAWIVWHSVDLFNKMKRVVPCDLQPISSGASTGEQKLAWFCWLGEMNKEETSYNIHAVWNWYFDSYIQPQLDLVL